MSEDPDLLCPITRSPWAHGLRDAALQLGPMSARDGLPAPEALAHRLGPLAPRNARGQPLRFADVPPPAKRRRRRAPGPIDRTALYDGQIYHRGVVPTRRGSWHDLFNALAWASFPHTKAAINEAQWRALEATLAPEATRLPNARSPAQDALAMLDEGGVLVALAPADEYALEAALAGCVGEESAVARALERYGAVPVLLGHALAEHWRVDEAPLRAMLLLVPVAEAPLRGYLRAPGPGTFRALREALDAAAPRCVHALTARPRCAGVVRPRLFAPRTHMVAF